MSKQLPCEVLRAIDLTINLADNIILKDINLVINENETICFIGPSGSGKTVLIKALLGLIIPMSGKVLIYGMDWLSLDPTQKHDLALKIGVVFQQSALFDHLNVVENILFPVKEFFDYSDEKLTEIADELLSSVNLLEAKNKYPAELSGGMQRRLGIARALVLKPKLVFYDDPVAGQDPMQRDQMLTLIKKYKDDNKTTVVMVTSSVKIAFKVSDRIFLVINKSVIPLDNSDKIKVNQDAIINQFITGSLDGPIHL